MAAYARHSRETGSVKGRHEDIRPSYTVLDLQHLEPELE